MVQYTSFSQQINQTLFSRENSFIQTVTYSICLKKICKITKALYHYSGRAFFSNLWIEVNPAVAANLREKGNHMAPLFSLKRSDLWIEVGSAVAANSGVKEKQMVLLLPFEAVWFMNLRMLSSGIWMAPMLPLEIQLVNWKWAQLRELIREKGNQMTPNLSFKSVIYELRGPSCGSWFKKD